MAIKGGCLIFPCVNSCVALTGRIPQCHVQIVWTVCVGIFLHNACGKGQMHVYGVPPRIQGQPQKVQPR